MIRIIGASWVRQPSSDAEVAGKGKILNSRHGVDIENQGPTLEAKGQEKRDKIKQGDDETVYFHQ